MKKNIHQILMFATSFSALCLVACDQGEGDTAFNELEQDPAPSNLVADPINQPGVTALQGEDMQVSTAQRQERQERQEGETNSNKLELQGGSGETVLEVERQGPAEIRLGEAYNYMITVRNVSDHPVHNVVLRETVSGLELAEGQQARQSQQTPPQQQRQGAQQQSGQQQQQSQPSAQNEWQIAVLQPGEEQSIEAVTRATALGSAASCLVVDFQPSLCTDVAVVQPQLEVERHFVNAEGEPIQQAFVCEEAYALYIVSNVGTGTTEPVTLMEEIPAEISGRQQAIQIDVGPLEEGQTEEFREQLNFQTPASYEGVAIARTDSMEVRTNRARLAVLAPQIDVQISGPQQQYINRPLTYYVSVTNQSEAPALDTEVSLNVDIDMHRMSVSGQGVQQAEDSIRIGRVDPGQTRNFNVTFEAGQPGEINATASARAYCAQEASATVATNLLGVPAVQLEVVDTQDPVQVGEQTTYLIRVLNEGTGEGIGINVNAQVPEGMTLANVAGATQGQAQGNQVSFEPLPSLAPGEVAEYEVVATADAPMSAQFHVSLSSDAIAGTVGETEPTTVY